MRGKEERVSLLQVPHRDAKTRVPSKRRMHSTKSVPKWMTSNAWTVSSVAAVTSSISVLTTASVAKAQCHGSCWTKVWSGLERSAMSRGHT